MNKFSLLILLGIATIFSSCDDDDNNIINDITMQVNALAIDNTNVRWVATDKGLYKSSEEGYKLIESTSGSVINFLFFEESNNLLWVGNESGLSKVDLTLEDYSDLIIDTENLSDKHINSMYIDGNAKRWLSTENGFTMNYNDVWKKEYFGVANDGSLDPLQIEDYPINSISSVNGDYYFATNGMYLYRAANFDNDIDAFTGASQLYPPYNGPAISDTMFVIFVDNEGKKWMGGTEGIQTHAGTDWKDIVSFEYFYDELPDSYILAINQAPDGKIWAGTRKGLAIFDGTNWEVVTEGLSDLYITAIEFNNDGSAWIGTKKGLVNIQQ